MTALLATTRNRIILAEILFLLLCFAWAGWRGVVINAIASVWTAAVMGWLAKGGDLAEGAKQ